MPQSVRDRLCNQFSRLEQGPMTVSEYEARAWFQPAVQFLMWSIMLDPWSIFIARPKGASIRGHATRATTTGPRLERGTPMIGPAKGLNFRHNMYPSYKSNRSPTPDTIVQGLQFLKASLKAMSIKVIEQVPGVEADDVIGTLAVRSVDAGFKVRVVSPDKDFFQILSPSLRLLRIAPRGFEMVSFGMEEFAGKYGGLKPSQFVDLTSLMGDKSDNIPGVHGIGDVHAIQLIAKFGTLENLLECIEQVEEERIRKALLSNAELARLSKDLAILRCDLPSYMVPFVPDDLIFEKPEDGGEKFTSLLTAISAYAEGFSADNIIRRTLYLWKKLEKQTVDTIHQKVASA
ncbi:hypothetical protein MTR67_012836 [Solanum verrucosum]|uniref:5'-3' exonuclease domain-containing protein n=1 Tax=Solanum verrucosum TaxID=315347 RepID=A0AAF0QF78_SOLVR|nr:hypothetical protein MTR67_012836 [Solanum verrucosum]